MDCPIYNDNFSCKYSKLDESKVSTVLGFRPIISIEHRYISSTPVNQHTILLEKWVLGQYEFDRIASNIFSKKYKKLLDSHRDTNNGRVHFENFLTRFRFYILNDFVDFMTKKSFTFDIPELRVNAKVLQCLEVRKNESETNIMGFTFEIKTF